METSSSRKVLTKNSAAELSTELRCGSNWRAVAACSNCEARSLVPLQTALRFKVLPLRIYGEGRFYRKTLSVLASHTASAEDLRNLGPLTNCDIVMEYCDEEGLLSAIFAAYHGTSCEISELASKALIVNSGGGLGGEQNISVLAERIIAHALSMGASDVHIEPRDNCTKIMLRIDGFMQSTTDSDIPKDVAPLLLRRYKILANLDINNNFVPQEGSFLFRFQDVSCSIRVSSVPTLNGEKVAMRILQSSLSGADFKSLDNLGLGESQIEILRSAISQNDGVIAVAGPTGSGKSTLIAALLRELAEGTRLVVSIEDPIESVVPGATQVQVDPKRGRSYDSILPVILRQDPDVICVGETRDAAVAKLVFSAGQSGHLALTTIHAVGAMEVPARFINLGLSSYQFWSILKLSVGTRLVQLNCPYCLQEVLPTERFSSLFRIGPKTGLKVGIGCFRCNNTGILGRKALLELLPITNLVREHLSKENPFELCRSIPAINVCKSMGYSPFSITVRQHLIDGAISPQTALKTLGLPISLGL